MIIRLYNCDNSLLSTDNFVSVIETSSPKIFSNIIYDILNQSLPAKELAIFDNDKLLKANDILLISDFINIDLSAKSILSKIYKYIGDYISIDIEKKIVFEKLVKTFNIDIYSIINDIDIDFEFNECTDIKDVFSMMKLKPLIEEDNLLSKLLQYLNICAEMRLYKLVFLVNIKSYLSVEELKQLYKHAFYKNLSLLLLENTHKNILLNNEQKVFIDEDFCDIMYT